MEDNRREQLEALEVLVEFNERLVKNVNILIKELSGARLEDTDQFIKGIVDAMNWEIAVFNGTKEVLDEGTISIDRDEFNKKAVAVGNAIVAKDDNSMVKAFEEILPFFEKLGEAASAAVK